MRLVLRPPLYKFASPRPLCLINNINHNLHNHIINYHTPQPHPVNTYAGVQISVLYPGAGAALALSLPFMAAPSTDMSMSMYTSAANSASYGGTHSGHQSVIGSGIMASARKDALMKARIKVEHFENNLKKRHVEQKHDTQQQQAAVATVAVQRDAPT